MNLSERINTLKTLGASDSDMDALLAYTQNNFSPCEDNYGDDFLDLWEPVMCTASEQGAAAAINHHLARKDNPVAFECPESLRIEIFPSIAGSIPIISTQNVCDFENLVRGIIYKGKEVHNIEEMGASFASGKNNRFIVLSKKPYSNVSATNMGLDDALWKEKSLIIRKNHECAHYYTKRFFNSARNNLHDELIADFHGLYTAFGKYRAEWFLRFLGLTKDCDGVHGRIKLYTNAMSPSAAGVIEKLAEFAAHALENWSKTAVFSQMTETERINALCGKEILAIARQNCADLDSI